MSNIEYQPGGESSCDYRLVEAKTRPKYNTAKDLLQEAGISPFFANVSTAEGEFVHGLHLGDRHWRWEIYKDSVLTQSIIELMGALYKNEKFRRAMAPTVFGYPKGTPWEKIVARDVDGRNNVTRWLENYRGNTYDMYQDERRPGPEMIVFLRGKFIRDPKIEKWSVADEEKQMKQIENIDPRTVLGYMAISPLSKDPTHPFANGCSISMQLHPRVVGSGMGSGMSRRASLAALNYMHRLKSFNMCNPNQPFAVAITHAENFASQRLLASMGCVNVGLWAESARIHPEVISPFEKWEPTDRVFDADQYLESKLRAADIRLANSVSPIPDDRDMRLTYVAKPSSIFRALMETGLKAKDIRNIVRCPYDYGLCMNEYAL